MNSGAATVRPRLRRDTKGGRAENRAGLDGKARTYNCHDPKHFIAEVPYRRNTGTGLRGKVLYVYNTDLVTACE